MSEIPPQDSIPGSTGDSPVPSGNLPDRTGRRRRANRDGLPASSLPAVPVGGSPTGAGESPALPSAKITICMGSSCFSRGNSRNIEVVQDFLKTQSLPPAVELSGHLCEGHCKSGPNITINDKMYHEVDPIVIIALLNHYLRR